MTHRRPNHRIYLAMVAAIYGGLLREPFRTAEFKTACPGFSDRTYGPFLCNCRVDNPWGRPRLFERVDRGLYRLARPIKYELDVVIGPHRNRKRS